MFISYINECNPLKFQSYVDMFSQSLELEYRSKNIIVQSVVPGYVATKMGKIRQPSWTSPSPTDFAAKALKTVGIQRRTAVHFSHRLAVTTQLNKNHFIQS